MLKMEGSEPKSHGRAWGLRLGRLPLALSREYGVPLEAKRGSLEWEEEVVGVRSCLEMQGTCLLLSVVLSPHL